MRRQDFFKILGQAPSPFPMLLYENGTQYVDFVEVDGVGGVGTYAEEANRLRCSKGSGDAGGICCGPDAAIDMTGATKLKVTFTVAESSNTATLIAVGPTKDMQGSLYDYVNAANCYAYHQELRTARSMYTYELDISGIAGDNYIAIGGGAYTGCSWYFYIYKVELV